MLLGTFQKGLIFSASARPFPPKGGNLSAQKTIPFIHEALFV